MQRRDRNQLFTAANLVLPAVFLAGVWIIGLFRFAADIPDKIPVAETRTDAIVVLTGGSQRLTAGLKLLTQNRAARMFVSGVYRGLDVRRLLQIAKRSPGDLEQRISIGNAVDTTANAIETAAWARQQGIASIRLVTAAYHMPRSLLEFRQAMPMATIVPHPVFPESVKQLDWWAWPGTSALVISEYNKFLLAWARHRAAEWFKGEPAAKSSVQPATN